MSFKGQFLRGEKWSKLMTKEAIAKDPNKSRDVEVYREKDKKKIAEAEKKQRELDKKKKEEA